MKASDFRFQARQALQGNWLLAAGVTLVATLPTFVTNLFSGSGQEDSTVIVGAQAALTQDQLITALVVSFLSLAAVLALSFFVYSVINAGYYRFHLNLIDGGLPDFKDLFCRFRKGEYLVTVRLAIRHRLTIFGWTLLFIIPGILASYDYIMAYYVMLDHPELTPKECMKVSKAMMKGNRWRLFCLEISFIGWALLSAFTFGIGSLFLTPYTWSAQTAFYRSICYNVNIQDCIL